ncbi:MAG: GTP 3',8-cyclase MoaA [bacterium]
MLVDSFGRVHNYLRISVTDRCNFKCLYCNPFFIYKNKKELLSFEQIYRIAKILVNNTVEKIRITGGEPFVRKGLIDFLYKLNDLRIKELNISTNGYLLDNHLDSLIKIPKIKKINISLDTFEPTKFEFISRVKKDYLYKVIENIKEASKFFEVKLNTVMMKGINDDEIFDFIDFAYRQKLVVRFIELMPMRGNNYSEETFISYREIMERIGERYTLLKIPDPPNSTSKNYEVYEKGKLLCKIGFITSISKPFCFSCNRLRLTATGNFKPCLFSNLEINIKKFLHLPDEEILKIILNSLKLKKLIGVQETGNYMVEMGG